MGKTINRVGHLAGASRFRRISEKLYIDGDKIYKEAGLSFKASWFPVYYILSKTDEPLTVTAIASEMAFSHITVKNVLRELDKEKLILIEKNPNDKRSKLISLSHLGKELQKKLEPLWVKFSKSLKNIFEAGHPDIINILNRIDDEINFNPINERVKKQDFDKVSVVDYKPELKAYFFQLAGHWLIGILDGKLEAEDEFTLHNPDLAYLLKGGFVFFAIYKDKVVGCVALKRLDQNNFEFAKLFIHPNYRNLGIATKLIERCLSRCKENRASQLWLQTTLSLPQAHNLYYKLGFKDSVPPNEMKVLARTEKIMCIEL
ncbi:bifunctional helix-turn-helix transcriptional regulator/GNAT family N-acetyltransferase [Gillisia marina]|uniref:bifunctional helix-turn-helix transcriptional regulator/GNAT family N-acetyltransferase n=1 Tax=Gillisia marina TaxID=1167637 RepID=UPI00029A3944|nr:bifunctional helix-turn-helix transcriptional regulator/GNAT family N-acetyltransferase [Gillisia marina]